jgi:hypothetical protein
MVQEGTAAAAVQAAVQRAERRARRSTAWTQSAHCKVTTVSVTTASQPQSVSVTTVRARWQCLRVTIEAQPRERASTAPHSGYVTIEAQPRDRASTAPRTDYVTIEAQPRDRASTAPRTDYVTIEAQLRERASTAPRTDYVTTEAQLRECASTAPRTDYVTIEAQPRDRASTAPHSDYVTIEAQPRDRASAAPHSGYVTTGPQPRDPAGAAPSTGCVATEEQSRKESSDLAAAQKAAADTAPPAAQQWGEGRARSSASARWYRRARLRRQCRQQCSGPRGEQGAVQHGHSHHCAESPQSSVTVSVTTVGTAVASPIPVERGGSACDRGRCKVARRGDQSKEKRGACGHGHSHRQHSLSQRSHSQSASQSVLPQSAPPLYREAMSRDERSAAHKLCNHSGAAARSDGGRQTAASMVQQATVSVAQQAALQVAVQRAKGRARRSAAGRARRSARWCRRARLRRQCRQQCSGPRGEQGAVQRGHSQHIAKSPQSASPQPVSHSQSALPQSERGGSACGLL